MSTITVEFQPTVTLEHLQALLRFLPVSVTVADAEKNYYHIKSNDVMNFYNAGAAIAAAGIMSNQIS